MNAFARAFRPLAGFFFWAAQFGAIYAVTSVSCARGWWGASFLGIGVIPVTIGGATLAALGATVLVFRRAQAAQREDAQPSDRFLDGLTLWSCGLSFAAIVWNALPALILPACS